MAEGHSMTVADVVAKTMDGRLEDFVGKVRPFITFGAGRAPVTPTLRSR
jgi:hypothetical protein